MFKLVVNSKFNFLKKKSCNIVKRARVLLNMFKVPFKYTKKNLSKISIALLQCDINLGDRIYIFFSFKF